MSEEKAIDPICKMEVDTAKASKMEHNGKTYHFCSPTCQWAFEADPGQFVEAENKEEDK